MITTEAPTTNEDSFNPPRLSDWNEGLFHSRISGELLDIIVVVGFIICLGVMVYTFCNTLSDWMGMGRHGCRWKGEAGRYSRMSAVRATEKGDE